MNNLNKRLPITHARNRRFTDGNEPFQIAIHYHIENESETSIEQAYTALKSEGWMNHE